MLGGDAPSYVQLPAATNTDAATTTNAALSPTRPLSLSHTRAGTDTDVHTEGTRGETDTVARREACAMHLDMSSTVRPLP